MGGSPETSIRREKRKKQNKLEREMGICSIFSQAWASLSCCLPPFLVSVTPCSFISPPLPSPSPAGDTAPGPEGRSWGERDFPMRDQRKPPTCHLLAEGGKSSRWPAPGPHQLLPWGLSLPPSTFCKLLSGALVCLWSQKILQIIWED